MSEETYKGWELQFLEKQDGDGMWLDQVLPETVSGTMMVDLVSSYGIQNKIEKFKNKQEALASVMQKAKAFIDSQVR